MKYLVLLFVLSSCATFKDSKREKILDCTKELIEYDAAPGEAYMVCRDLYVSKQRQ